MTRHEPAPGFSRRGFLKASAAVGGGLLISFALPLGVRAVQAEAAAFAPNAYVRIDRQGHVYLTIQPVEMGQGTYTSMPALIAEELEVGLDQVTVEHAPADDKRYANPVLGFQVTGGSTSVPGNWKPLREAGAAARILLVAAAASQWKVDPASCRAEQGKVLHPGSGRQLAYGELVDAAAGLPLPEQIPLKDPKDFKLIGTPAPRTDSPDKINGQAVFGIDAHPDGMKVAAIQLCPVVGGTLAEVDPAPALAVAGVRQVLHSDNAVAVVADHMGAARKGMALLQPKWNEGANAGMSSAQMLEAMRKAAEQPGVQVRVEGDAASALAKASKRIDAVYQVPWLAHACLEPVNCTVHVRKDACELWLGSQVPARAKAVAAQITGLPEEAVTVHNHLLGGGFGRRLDVDFVSDAVKLAKQVDYPLKVIWSREEDTRHSTLRPYHYNHLSAALDEEGRPVAWTHKITGGSILARWLPAAFVNGVDRDAVRDACGPYAFPNLAVHYVRHEPPAGILPAFWRGVGHTQNAFMVEGLMDELAHLAGRDPFDFRYPLLEAHPRALKVLETLKDKSGWADPLPAGRGRGLALTYCFSTYSAQVAEVSVDDAGNVTVERITTVVDCGIAINPDSVVAQVQGGTLFGLTAALFGNITFKDGRVEQGNFDSYRMLRLNETPTLDTFRIDSPEAPGGLGEVATVTVAPAVVNAVFAATGKRLRSLPIDPQALRKA
ncbi:molybdopterin-dependent oxidoreductase [Pseudomonas guariconensis]|uniref:xanthine dehydrogenase family protein molybdopterin-binding subunit n=1 Tax=Pseudomonas TaxID=286 RepID=UPI001CE4502A|nr:MULTISPECIES: molybdopterin cofactor-binding domain-containing protein [Pseudomonas]MCO7637393.1 molybdopterin-dependent oxidoreductase [Pseudomonas sp. S 311-6]MCO7514093.1 molybdopterin-dependent oxidoreductase [Pseudomonas putida]MCO7564103.1 molybdopterin-dependent oxidoreductase [Pseudomonas mosselii]MCO7593972.1 molybdopterin-dependent oxidoreductase [Pseudomonas guariconensis]MCO7606981.1 molybdopterin-dependent oxidoreductase [Pseudomonas guariconensis]